MPHVQQMHMGFNMITYMRLPSVQAVTGLGRVSVYRHVNAGLLPKPVKIGERSTAWPEHEIAAINAARMAGKPDDAIRAIVDDLQRQRANAA
jgi:prophage regulatory protein